MKEFCFCTLAVGKRYRTHAKVLANDIQGQAPNMDFVVLTDKPAEFAEYPHVIAIKHRLQSVKGYHDKRFVIEKALEKFDTCIFLDSDVRIIGSVPDRLEWLPGITARSGCSVLKHHYTRTKLNLHLTAISHLAQKLDINLQEAKWFHEFMFVVKKQDGAEKDFLKFFEIISYFFEIQGIYCDEGSVMGLAAVKAGLTLRFDREDKFPFFKDNVEKVRIQKGQSNMTDKKIYFELHKEIEYPKRPIWKKIVDKLTGKTVFLYRLLRLKYLTKYNSDLQELL